MTNTPSPDEDRELIERVAKAVRDNLGWQHGHIPSQIRSENIARIAVRECLSDRAKLEEALRSLIAANERTPMHLRMPYEIEPTENAKRALHG